MLILNLLSLSEYNLWALKVRLNEEINPKYCLSMDGMAPRLRFTRPGQWLYQLESGQLLDSSLEIIARIARIYDYDK